VDATRGLGDFSDDLYALVSALRLRDGKIHLVGWSVGGTIAVRYATDHPDMVASLSLENPMSPYGFGETKDAFGIPCWPDYAGSGGGTTNPEFVRRLREGDRSQEDLNSPRNAMNVFYFKPPFRVPEEREEVLLFSMLSTKVAEETYPGDVPPSSNWSKVGRTRASTRSQCKTKRSCTLWSTGRCGLSTSLTSLRIRKTSCARSWRARTACLRAPILIYLLR
jgi:hypothetical protein